MVRGTQIEVDIERFNNLWVRSNGFLGVESMIRCVQDVGNFGNRLTLLVGSMVGPLTLTVPTVDILTSTYVAVRLSAVDYCSLPFLELPVVLV